MEADVARLCHRLQPLCRCLALARLHHAVVGFLHGLRERLLGVSVQLSADSFRSVLRPPDRPRPSHAAPPRALHYMRPPLHTRAAGRSSYPLSTARIRPSTCEGRRPAASRLDSFFTHCIPPSSQLSNESRSFLPLMPLSRLAARHSRMLSRSYGGRVCGSVACLRPVPTRSLSKPCLGHKNRTRGAAQGPSKPRNRQISQPTSPRARPSQQMTVGLLGSTRVTRP